MEYWWDRLLKVLQAYNWTYTELSRRTKVSRDSIKKYMGGHVQQPRGRVLHRMAKSLGVSLIWLQNGNPDLEPGFLSGIEPFPVDTRSQKQKEEEKIAKRKAKARAKTQRLDAQGDDLEDDMNNPLLTQMVASLQESVQAKAAMAEASQRTAHQNAMYGGTEPERHDWNSSRSEQEMIFATKGRQESPQSDVMAATKEGPALLHRVKRGRPSKQSIEVASITKQLAKKGLLAEYMAQQAKRKAIEEDARQERDFRLSSKASRASIRGGETASQPHAHMNHGQYHWSEHAQHNEVEARSTKQQYGAPSIRDLHEQQLLNLMRNTVPIPFYSMNVLTGMRSWEIETAPPAYWQFFDNKFLSMISQSTPSQLFAIIFVGDSMGDSLANGDCAFVDRSIQSITREGLYALYWSGGILVRRISVHPASGLVSIISDNKRYASFSDVKPSDIQIVGRVIWVGRCV